MKYWLIDFFLILFIFISIGCAKVEISYSGTAEDLIDTCLANNELDFPNNSVLEIEGQIKKVFFPKDTIKNNECIILLGTNDCNIDKLEGDFVSCKFSKRLDNIIVGQNVKIQGQYKNIFRDKSGITISLKNCSFIY